MRIRLMLIRKLDYEEPIEEPINGKALIYSLFRRFRLKDA
jgi:hypothetical protein